MAFGASAGINYGGGSYRSGPRPTNARGALRDAMRGAENAADDAKRAAAYNQEQQDPYRGMAPGGGSENPPSHDEGDKPGKLGGGTMGLTPDMSEYESRMKAFHQRRQNRPAWLAGFRGISDIWAAKDGAELAEIEGIKERAIRDAMQARAAATWNDTGVNEQGYTIEQNALDPSKRRVKTYNETYKEEMEGPARPGEEAPYREAMRQVPVMAQNTWEKKATGTQQAEHDARVAAEAAANDTRDTENARSLAQFNQALDIGTENVRSRNALALAGKQGAEARKTNKEAVEVGAKGVRDPYSTPAGEGQLLENAIDDIVTDIGYTSRAAFDSGATEAERAEFKRRIAEEKKAIADRTRGRHQTPMGPNDTADYGGPVTAAPEIKPGTRKKAKVQGRDVTVERTKDGKWKVVEDPGGAKK